jgi:DNA-directed RNA polymerase specialized sigma24 family protein
LSPNLADFSDRLLVPFDERLAVRAEEPIDLQELDEALTRLEAFPPRQARVVDLRYFAGLNINATADEIWRWRSLAIK